MWQTAFVQIGGWTWLSRAFRRGAPSRAGVPALLLFDGRCGLCSKLVQFALKRDHQGAFQFAALESAPAAAALAPHGGLAGLPDSAIVLVGRGTPEEHLLLRSDAILFVADQVGHPWRLALLGGALPRFLRDFLYDRLAAWRAVLFGRRDTCLVPTPAERARFLT